ASCSSWTTSAPARRWSASAKWTSDETHEKIRIGGRLPEGGPSRPAGRVTEAAQGDQGRRARGDRGHQLRDPDVQAPWNAGGLRRLQGALQPLHEHRTHAGAQESTRAVPNVQGHHPLHDREAPARGAGAQARQGPGRAERGQAVTVSDAHRAIEAVWRIESAKVIAGLTRLTGDVGTAEDLAQDALVAALERWPESGVPDNPGAWLMATAKHRGIDALRRGKLLERKHVELGHELEAHQESPEGELAAALDDHFGDDLLSLGRILAELVPQEPEVHGLVALMSLQTSRASARVGPSGEPILLLDQDRSRWDHLLIRRGLAALERAVAPGGGYGPYALQAAIAACHARAATPEETDWTRIVALYDGLAQLLPSPVVNLNRAVALAMAFGPAAGLEVVDTLRSEPALEGYHLLPAVRGDLLDKLGRFAEARAEFERAASLTRNARERTLLLERAAACGHRSAAGEK